MAKGAVSRTFLFRHEGNAYVLRKTRENDISDVDKYVAGGFLAQNLQGFEQLVAASYDEHATISRFLPGRITANLSLNVLRAISKEQIRNLVNMIITGKQKKIGFDFHGDNVLYDPKEGFSILDFHSNAAHPEYDFYYLLSLFENPENSTRYRTPANADLCAAERLRVVKYLKKSIEKNGFSYELP